MIESPTGEFQVNTLEALEKFEALTARSMGQRRHQITGGYLANAFTALEYRRDRNRLMAALVDLHLTSCFIRLDRSKAGDIWNEQIADPFSNANDLDILDNPDLFDAKFHALHTFNAMAFRCRAFWDKWMGFLVLHFSPEDYDAFVKARKRKKRFLKLAPTWTNFPRSIQSQMLHRCQGLPDFAGWVDLYQEGKLYPGPFLSWIEARISALDATYRTAEAHGTGTLRKWSFSSQPDSPSKDYDLIAHADTISGMINGIRGMFNDAELYDFTTGIPYRESKRGASLNDK